MGCCTRTSVTNSKIFEGRQMLGKALLLASSIVLSLVGTASAEDIYSANVIMRACTPHVL